MDKREADENRIEEADMKMLKDLLHLDNKPQLFSSLDGTGSSLRMFSSDQEFAASKLVARLQAQPLDMLQYAELENISEEKKQVEMLSVDKKMDERPVQSGNTDANAFQLRKQKVQQEVKLLPITQSFDNDYEGKFGNYYASRASRVAAQDIPFRFEYGPPLQPSAGGIQFPTGPRRATFPGAYAAFMQPTLKKNETDGETKQLKRMRTPAVKKLDFKLD